MCHLTEDESATLATWIESHTKQSAAADEYLVPQKIRAIPTIRQQRELYKETQTRVELVKLNDQFFPHFLDKIPKHCGQNISKQDANRLLNPVIAEVTHIHLFLSSRSAV